MGKKTTITTAVLFAMGSMGTCMASQLPTDSNILNLPLAVSSSSITDNIILVAENEGIKVKAKNETKFKPGKKGKETLVALGTFTKTRRKARKGRNPQTGGSN